MMSRLSRSLLTLVVLIPILAFSPGCGGAGRITSFTKASAPAATVSQITVRITETVRRPDEVEVALTVVNPTAHPITFARHYGRFTAATMTHGDLRVTGMRTPKQSRTIPHNGYTVLAGEEAGVRLAFRAAGMDRAERLTLQIVGTAHGAELSWTIPIPPEPSRPASMAIDH